MSRESGFVPLIFIIPALILLVVGGGAGAYYYVQNRSASEVNSSPAPEPQMTTFSPSPVASAVDTDISTTPRPIDTPSPLNTPIATSSAVPQIKVIESTDSAILDPKCGIMFETSFDIFVEQGDTAATISQKAVNLYLNKAKLATANSAFPTFSAQQKSSAQTQLQKSLALSNLKVGQKVSVPCTEVEKACSQAQSTKFKL